MLNKIYTKNTVFMYQYQLYCDLKFNTKTKGTNKKTVGLIDYP